jgi:EAL domain-containing protein (putative c-di-GMP-specific phosphodiesterase class I)/CheY-like chemotaxis protein
MARILVVDDEPLIRKQIARILGKQGHVVQQASNAKEALKFAGEKVFDLSLVDYNLPEQDGLYVLQSLREVQPGCLRILITGMLNLHLAVHAVNSGEISHVVEKPFKPTELLKAVEASLSARKRMVEVARVQQEVAKDEERKILDDCLTDENISLALQPLICGKYGSVEAFEALLRSNHPVLNGPLPIIRAAEKHECLSQLADIIFRKAKGWLEKLPGDFRLFVNIHPDELADPEGMKLRLEILKPWAERIVLEITERSRLQAIASWEETLDYIIEQGFLVAVDDLGAGYSSLSVLADLQPKYIKMDMSIIRNVHIESRKRRLVELLCKFAEATDAMIVAEGVEVEGEMKTLIECGAHLLQGYYFARPQLSFEDVSVTYKKIWNI